MDNFNDVFFPFSLPVLVIGGWFAYMIVRTLARARVRELEVRERIAMIERGLVPPPEKDPNGFDRAMNRYERSRDDLDDWDRGYRRPNRYRSAGVTLMGVGFGMMTLLAFTAGEARVALGVGGFLVVMGLAFLVNGFFSNRAGYYRYPYPPYPPYPPHSRPPQSNVRQDPPSNG